jgi:cell division protease FtsH
MEVCVKSFRLMNIVLATALLLPQQARCTSESWYAETARTALVLAASTALAATTCAALFYGFQWGAQKFSSYFLSPGAMHKAGAITSKFSDIAGKENEKEELEDIVDYLRNPEKYHAIGTKVPRGVLMHGPPGTGKTSLARAMAGEVSCSFISITGSELNGRQTPSASLVKALLRRARSCAPCIIFIDEIDSLDGEAQKQLLTEMDGFEIKKELVMIIGATNAVNLIHQGLLRPGRFDRVVKVDLPNLLDRKKILAMYAARVKMAESVNLGLIAELTTNFSGADLANLINEASIIAIHAGKTHIEQVDLEAALDKLSMGKPVKDRPITQEERRMIAYHEAGHALLTVLLEGQCNPLHKVTIVMRDGVGGFTATIPQSTIGATKEQMIATITVAYGGRAAEKLVFNKLTTGAQSDFAQATHFAKIMVCEYGMIDNIGPIAFPQLYMITNEPEFIKEAIRTILFDAYNSALKLLTENRGNLDLIANALLEKETLSAKEVYALLGMKQSAQCNTSVAVDTSEADTPVLEFQ